jgi:hypothetical protein
MTRLQINLIARYYFITVFTRTKISFFLQNKTQICTRKLMAESPTLSPERYRVSVPSISASKKLKQKSINVLIDLCSIGCLGCNVTNFSCVLYTGEDKITVALKQWKQSFVSLVQHNKKSKFKKMSLRKVVHLT